MSNWTTEELSLLCKLKNEGLSWEDIADKLPGRTAHDCQQQLHIQTLPNKKKRILPWTSAEDAILRQYRNEGLKVKDIAKRLPGRNASSVQRRLVKLSQSKHKIDQRNKKWTFEEDVLLCQYKNQGFGYKEMAQMLGRTAESCNTRFKRIAPTVDKRPKHKIWTSEEDAILCQYKNKGFNYNEIAKRLPGRLPNSCRQRYNKNRRLTNSDGDQLHCCLNNDNMSFGEISTTVDRSAHSCKYRVSNSRQVSKLGDVFEDQNCQSNNIHIVNYSGESNKNMVDDERYDDFFYHKPINNFSEH